VRRCLGHTEQGLAVDRELDITDKRGAWRRSADAEGSHAAPQTKLRTIRIS
jgi:hypothetical protein